MFLFFMCIIESINAGVFIYLFLFNLSEMLINITAMVGNKLRTSKYSSNDLVSSKAIKMSRFRRVDS